MSKQGLKKEFDLEREMAAIGVAAGEAAAKLALSKFETRQKALHCMSIEISNNAEKILTANEQDIEHATTAGISEALLDRLKLTKSRITSLSKGLIEVAELDDPIGRILDTKNRPNGLTIDRVSVPIGVIAIIYESRPNVTADAGALCLMSGNAAILRGGSESFYSSRAIVSCMHAGLRKAGLPEASIQLAPTSDRAAVGIMLSMENDIDLVVPRGGKSLIERIKRDTRIPVLAHLQGLCHTYIHSKANHEMAQNLLFNAKMRRTGICGATETVLVDEAISKYLPEFLNPLVEAGCELRGDTSAQALDSRIIKATELDWETEYLSSILSIRIVKDINEAILHVNHYGSHHTDSIITKDVSAARRFMDEVDSGIVMHNTSTQFADGGEFGMGAEIGISTGKLHARGPVGVEQLTTYKYKVRSDGQVRP